jgi:hypothetical protein
MRRLTVEQAKELQSSEGWQGVLAELDSRTEVCFTQMATCKADDLVMFQAKLRVFQEVKGILQAVIDRES